MDNKVIYRLVEKKNSISVYAGETVTCQIDDDFAIRAGYENALDYCKTVFLSENPIMNEKIIASLENRIDHKRNILDTIFNSNNSFIEYEIRLAEKFIAFVESKTYEFLSFTEASDSFNRSLVI